MIVHSFTAAVAELQGHVFDVKGSNPDVYITLTLVTHRERNLVFKLLMNPVMTADRINSSVCFFFFH